MDSAELLQWVTLGLVLAGLVGGVIGYMIKQNVRIATVEAEIKQLTKLVNNNAKTVHELAITLSAVGERLQSILEAQRNS